MSFDPAAEFMNAECGSKLLTAGWAQADTTLVFVCLTGSFNHKYDNLGHMEFVEELFRLLVFIFLFVERFCCASQSECISSVCVLPVVS